jgi:SAM-dependent methyltransferase
MRSRPVSSIRPAVNDPRTQIVADGYDAIGDAFAEWRERFIGDTRRQWEDDLVSRLAAGARVLELGCGGGAPETRRLAERFRVTGVDISPRQVERAREALPEAEFICADCTSLELPAGSYEACVSFLIFNHIPRELLAPLLTSVHDWLVPGGWLLAGFGTSDTDAWFEAEWLGAPMFFSSFPPDVNSQLVREAGFEIVRDEVVSFHEPEPEEHEARAQWILASR